MTDYTLHYAPDNASLIIRLALEAQGVAYDTCLVDRAAQGQSAPAYRALNPHGLIPALQTPDGPMFETGAILLWLARGAGPCRDGCHAGGFPQVVVFRCQYGAPCPAYAVLP